LHGFQKIANSIMFVLSFQKIEPKSSFDTNNQLFTVI
jgi:hypothetical protein